MKSKLINLRNKYGLGLLIALLFQTFIAITALVPSVLRLVGYISNNDSTVSSLIRLGTIILFAVLLVGIWNLRKLAVYCDIGFRLFIIIYSAKQRLPSEKILLDVVVAIAMWTIVYYIWIFKEWKRFRK